MTEHKTLVEALCAFQAEAPKLTKDSVNPHYKSRFTSLDTIVETVRPLLAKHGLTWSTFPCVGPNGEPAMRYTLAHVSGDINSEVMPLLLSKQDAQGLGSALTYARRYSISAVLNLVSDTDDDGNQASKPAAQKAVTAEFATPEQIEAMRNAAQDLQPDQVKMALAACGISGVTAYNRVPTEKVGLLVKQLVAVERS